MKWSPIMLPALWTFSWPPKLLAADFRPEVVFQVSAPVAPKTGLYDGHVTFRELKKHERM
jgi:hypothetical protein